MINEPLQFHISLNVRDMLAKADSFLCDLYRCEPGDVPEIRARLVIAHAMGHAFIPLNGECDNFDPQSGCKGHAAQTQDSFLRYR
jgi:hypothetical protein